MAKRGKRVYHVINLVVRIVEDKLTLCVCETFRRRLQQRAASVDADVNPSLRSSMTVSVSDIAMAVDNERRPVVTKRYHCQAAKVLLCSECCATVCEGVS